MAKATDIKLQEDQDLFIDPNTGDFSIALSDPQHVRDILTSYAGWWKETPTLGVGVALYLGSSGGIQRLKRNIIIQMGADGYRADSVDIVKGEVYVTGDRIKNV
tara:strand:- start:715 stop:1026 length:312 start_codon:yes stop_codon:yes gene_type:complete